PRSGSDLTRGPSRAEAGGARDFQGTDPGLARARVPAQADSDPPAGYLALRAAAAPRRVRAVCRPIRLVDVPRFPAAVRHARAGCARPGARRGAPPGLGSRAARSLPRAWPPRHDERGGGAEVASATRLRR